MKKPMLVSELLVECYSLKPVEESTLVNWTKAIRPIKDCELQSITRRDVQIYIVKHWRNKHNPDHPWADRTMKQRLGSLCFLWNWAIKWEYLEGSNPWFQAGEDIKPDKTKSYPDRPFSFYEPFHHDPMFLCIWYHGCRLGEIAGLEKQDIVFNHRIPYFRFIDTKLRKLKNSPSTRDVPIHPSCYSIVDQLKTSRAKVGQGRGWSKRFRRDCGLPSGEAAHSLRHSFHTRCRSAGIEDSMMDALTGHGKYRMGANYGNFKLEDKYTAITKLPDEFELM